VTGDKLTSKLRWHSLPKAISLVKALKERQLCRLQGFFINNWLDTPVEVLMLIFRVSPIYEIRRLNELHLWMNHPGVYVVRVTL